MLIACRECGETVSSEASKCPHCGVRINTPQRGIFGSLIKVVFYLFNGIMAIVFLRACNATQDKIADLSSGVDPAVSQSMQAGSAMGFSFVLVIWLVIAAFLGVLVYITRPRD